MIFSGICPCRGKNCLLWGFWRMPPVLNLSAGERFFYEDPGQIFKKGVKYFITGLESGKNYEQLSDMLYAALQMVQDRILNTEKIKANHNNVGF